MDTVTLTLRHLTDEIVPLVTSEGRAWGFRRRARLPNGTEYECAISFQAATVAECVQELNRVFAEATVAFDRAWQRVLREVQNG
jgi:hypothetical protein